MKITADELRVIVVELTDDYRVGPRIVAQKGRRGKVDQALVGHYGVGQSRKEPAHFPVLLQGNRIRRDVPNWLLRLC